MHSRLYLGEAEQRGVLAQGDRGGGNVQGEKAVEGKLRRLWGNNSGVVIEGAYLEAT